MSPALRKGKRLLIAAAIGVVLGSFVVLIASTEAALHIVSRPQPDEREASGIAHAADATWEPASIAAADGVPLNAWLFVPRTPNGSAVILLHGVGDTRSGVTSHAAYLLGAGFTVLAPDSRGHGTSGGSLITYGVREAGDVHAWAGWLARKRPGDRLYGLGESMGAAILLQSLPVEPRFRAVVAECPFDSFEDVAYYRLRHASGLGWWAAFPAVQFGLGYTRWIHGVDLRQASPRAAIRSAKIPILLIHGSGDVNIPPAESEVLRALNPQWTTLWMIPGATHVMGLYAAGDEYVRRVTGWFQSHP